MTEYKLLVHMSNSEKEKLLLLAKKYERSMSYVIRRLIRESKV